MKSRVLIYASACFLFLGGSQSMALMQEFTGQFPPDEGEDEFPVSAAQLGIDLTLDGIPDTEIAAEGPFLVHRSAPQPGSDGRRVIQTEIVAMELTGSSALGPVTIRLNPDRRSTGQIVGKAPEQDFPADSFFDIFVTIEVGGQNLVNQTAIRVEAVITEIPPKITIYRSFRDPIIPLFGPAGNLVALLLHVAHAPNPDTPIRNEDLKILIERVQLRLELVEKELKLFNQIQAIGHRSHLLFTHSISAPPFFETGLAITNITGELSNNILGVGQATAGNCNFKLYPADDPQNPILISSQTLAQQGLGSGFDSNGFLPPGGTARILVGQLLQAAGKGGTSFAGQIFVWCAFPAAQGINFISDSNFSTQAQGYPAIVIR